jgi:hypothetical protein
MGNCLCPGSLENGLKDTAIFPLSFGYYRGSGIAINDCNVHYNSPSYEILLQRDGTLTGRSVYLPIEGGGGDSVIETCLLRGVWKVNGYISLIEKWRGQDYQYNGIFKGKHLIGQWNILKGKSYQQTERRNRGKFRFTLDEVIGFPAWNTTSTRTTTLTLGSMFVGDGVAINKCGFSYSCPPAGYRFEMKTNGEMSGYATYVEGLGNRCVHSNNMFKGKWKTNGSMSWVEDFHGTQYVYDGVFDGTNLIGRWHIHPDIEPVPQARNTGAFWFNVTPVDATLTT